MTSTGDPVAVDLAPVRAVERTSGHVDGNRDMTDIQAKDAE